MFTLASSVFGFGCPRQIGKTPSSMNAISRERFTPAASSDSVSPSCLRAMVAGSYWLPLEILHRNVQDRAAHAVTRRPSRPGGLHRALLILYASLPLGPTL